MSLRVLVLGSGGREHALAWKLAGEQSVEEVVVAPGLVAMAELPGVSVRPLDWHDKAALVGVARASRADLVVVGPEMPLALGVATTLRAASIPVFGPTPSAALLETSKSFCHEVAAAANVAMARSRAFRPDERPAAAEWIRRLDGDGARAVLKMDALAGGKGVIVTDSLEQALDLMPSFLAGRDPRLPQLVIEERLSGREASVIAICDGERAVALPAARDHKRLCDADAGPNTGGMGAYSPLPDLDETAVETILETVHRPLLSEMSRRGDPFVGFLYAGLMLTDAGPRLLECNVRLGDPEAQVILPRLATDLAPVLDAAAGGRLPSSVPACLPVVDDAAVGIVLAAKGYPGEPRRGDPIEGIAPAQDLGALVFHAGTQRRPNGHFGTNGGRVLTVVGRGPALADARAVAERAAETITWSGMQRRHDIAAEVPSARAGIVGSAA